MGTSCYAWRSPPLPAGQLDLLELPASLASNVLESDGLKPAFADKGVRLYRQVEPSMSFFFFNMDDPLVGGYTPAKIALRRAISLAYDRDRCREHHAR